MREALIDAFDFEYTNKNIMYGAYKRTVSLFQNSPMMAAGKPDAAELALLEPFRGKVPDEVFGEPYVPPVTDGSRPRRALAAARRAAARRGGLCRRQNGKRVLPDGEPITIEFLDRRAGPSSRTICPTSRISARSASRRACASSIRCNTAARVDDFDFDITVDRLSFSSTPGDSLRSLFVVAGGLDQRLAESRRHRRSGDRRDGRSHHRRQDARRTRPSPAGRSTACSAPAATGFRTGTCRRTGSPIGTCSAGPRHRPRYFRGIPETWWYDSDKAAKLEQKG